MRLFHICTLVTKAEQYRAMRESFVAAGFDEERCRYTMLDNREGNRHEGFGAFNALQAGNEEPYIIYCHQDLILDSGDGFGRLLGLVREMDRKDPRWAVLGNTGWTNLIHCAVNISDPSDRHMRAGRLPQRVESLDENFLVIKTEAGIQCSPELSGYHLYATDICLAALRRGYTSYVIDFHLTHLSRGNKSHDFYEVRRRFADRWSREFKFRFVRTPSTIVFLSRYRPLRSLFDSRPVRFALSRPLTIKILARLFPLPA